jgi:hypothetical protein
MDLAMQQSGESFLFSKTLVQLETPQRLIDKPVNKAVAHPLAQRSQRKPLLTPISVFRIFGEIEGKIFSLILGEILPKTRPRTIEF